MMIIRRKSRKKKKQTNKLQIPRGGVPRLKIKEVNHIKNCEKRSTRVILAYVVMADDFVC